MAIGLVGLGLTLGSAGCDEPCCDLDSESIRLARGSGGELLTVAAIGNFTAGPALLDTGSPVTVWRTDVPTEPATMRRRTLRILGAGSPDPGGPPSANRAVLRRISVLEASVAEVGVPGAALTPAAIVGGDALLDLSAAIDFTVPALRLWSRQPAPESFLSSVGYTVLRLDRLGGGAFEIRDPDNLFDARESRAFRPARLLLRACVAPARFARDSAEPEACCRADRRRLASGVDTALLLSTGVGPTILSRSAWNRIVGQVPGLPDPLQGRPLLLAASREPISASWSQLPRLALVDREVSARLDQGPCVELARARRLEQVAARQVAVADRPACALPCDRDPDDPRLAQASAGYLELADAIEVAVIEDGTPFLQAARAEVRPEGPEVDGLLGANALGSTRLEIDSTSTSTRLIFSCAATSDSCRAVGRCPRLPGPGPERRCFGLPAHRLPSMCETPATACGP